MLGAIIGDIVGSGWRPWDAGKEDYEMVSERCRFTGNAVMTLAVAEWLMSDPDHTEEGLVECMQRLGREYPDAGYGSLFKKWLSNDKPQPYASFDYKAALRVSPVGMYAESIEEALELARVSASVTHNHPEGIRRAQAVAGCVYLKRKTDLGADNEIRRFIEDKIGYDLNFNLWDICDGCKLTRDLTYIGDIPIAIKIYLQHGDWFSDNALRLALEAPGDSEINSNIFAAICGTERLGCTGGCLRAKLEKRCRNILPPELLYINDRFEAFISRPLYQSYYLHESLFAGEYPGGGDEESARRKIKHILHFGVKHFIDLTEEGEMRQYKHLLPKNITYFRFPIPKRGTPGSIESVSRLLDKIGFLAKMDGYTYIHSKDGLGRASTIVGCLKARQLQGNKDWDAVTILGNFFRNMPKSVGRKALDTPEQEKFVKAFEASESDNREKRAESVKDSIRGCLIAGAAGEALGRQVEPLNRKQILQKYGDKGISRFDLDFKGKALVGNGTQMTIFTGTAILRGRTRSDMRGIGSHPERYAFGLGIETYRTKDGKEREILAADWLPARRLPYSDWRHPLRKVRVDEGIQSKGCSGMLRAVPMALWSAGYSVREEHFYPINEMDTVGAEIARDTHKHPLGFLPAAMLTHILFQLVQMSPEFVREEFDGLALGTIDSLADVFPGKFEEDKRRLAEITGKAVCLSKNDLSDAENISRLGEGWTGDEAWAIALYCAMRHSGSVEDAIRAAVNHDGNSSVTGMLCGYIIGAVHGYEAIKRRRIFCPDEKDLERTLEYSKTILELADDLFTSCIIDEYTPLDTPEKKRWYKRYGN